MMTGVPHAALTDARAWASAPWAASSLEEAIPSCWATASRFHHGALASAAWALTNWLLVSCSAMIAADSATWAFAQDIVSARAGVTGAA